MTICHFIERNWSLGILFPGFSVAAFADAEQGKKTKRANCGSQSVETTAVSLLSAREASRRNREGAFL